MDVQISKRTLQTLLARVSPAVAKNATMPVLSCLLLEAVDGKLVAYASNTYTSIRSSAEAAVAKPGTTAVNAKTVGDIVKNLPEGDVSLQVSGNGLLIRSGKIKFKLPTMPAEDFPTMPAVPDDAPAVVLKASALATLLRAVTYAASSDDSRPHLNGINLEADPGKVIAVCTDGHRMAFTSIEPERGAFANAVLVPANAFPMLKAAASAKDKDALVTLLVDGNRLHIRTAEADLTVMRADEQFPPYSKVIPADGAKHRITVRRDAMVDSVKRIALVAGDKSGGVHLDLEAGKLTVVSENPDVGEGSEELDVDYAGPGLRAGCNAKYLLDALESFVSDEVTLESNGELDPFKLTAAGETSCSVVMPMRR